MPERGISCGFRTEVPEGRSGSKGVRSSSGAATLLIVGDDVRRL